MFDSGARVMVIGGVLSVHDWFTQRLGTVLDSRMTFGHPTYSVRLDSPVDGREVHTLRDCDLMAAEE